MAKLRIKRIAGFTVLFAGVAAIGVLAPVAATGAKNAAEPDAGPERAREEAVRVRKGAIERELARVGPHAWAGDYAYGNGLGANVSLSLAPRAGVAALWRGCVGTYAANLGDVLPQADGQLALAFAYPNRAREIGFPERLVPVRWGERRYLLAPGQLDGFVASLHHGDEPRTDMLGGFLLARGDEAKAVSGLPSLPEEYRRRIRGTAVIARVTRVDALAGDAGSMVRGCAGSTIG